jgi:acyl-CoA reductase-like NAD-dependent aldehyde dehydrogenase
LRQGIPFAYTSIGGGDGNVDIGSMSMPRKMEVIQFFVDDAMAKGATLHCGRQRNPNLDGQFLSRS